MYEVKVNFLYAVTGKDQSFVLLLLLYFFYVCEFRENRPDEVHCKRVSQGIVYEDLNCQKGLRLFLFIT